eukprot:1601734-Amphidinium_carterae.1
MPTSVSRCTVKCASCGAHGGAASPCALGLCSTTYSMALVSLLKRHVSNKAIDNIGRLRTPSGQADKRDEESCSFVLLTETHNNLRLRASIGVSARH